MEENNKLPHIHISDVRYFKQCRTKWHFSSPIRRGLTPIATTSTALYTGTIIHEALDLYYNPEIKTDGIVTCLKLVWQSEMERVDEEYRQSPEGKKVLAETFYKCLGILKNYIAWAKPLDDQYVVLGSEMDFVVPLIPYQCDFAGRVDVVVADRKTGDLWVMDHKTTSTDFNWYSTYLSTVDEQAKAYIWALRKVFAAPVKGIIFNLIRNKAPSEPQLLKSGQLSRNKSSDTTWEVYKEAIQEYGLRVQDYMDMKEILQDRALYKPFTTRIHITFPDHVLDRYAEQLSNMALQMTDPTVPIYPSPSFMNCRGCAFIDPCQALHSDGDQAAEFLLATGYGRGRYVLDALELMDTAQMSE